MAPMPGSREAGTGMALTFYGEGSDPHKSKKVIAETDKFYEENKSRCQMEQWVDLGEESLSTYSRQGDL